ncbi:TPA: RNA-directed DNA polymerase, partial [Enterobacter hormaechei]|nr:RNA-directed DNA polymerase [Escherichia coli]HCD6754884.1 RNA-directed DNA polymerase [Enterobacter hormaechei]
MLKSILRKINNKIFSQINFPDYLYGSIPDKENPR